MKINKIGKYPFNNVLVMKYVGQSLLNSYQYAKLFQKSTLLNKYA